MRRIIQIMFFLFWSLVSVNAQQNLKKVTLTPDLTLSSIHAGFIMADSLGIYEKYGIDFSFHSSKYNLINKHGEDPGVNNFKILNLETAIDINTHDSVHIMNICQLSQVSSLAIIAHKESGIVDKSQLSGKRIVVRKGLFRDSLDILKTLAIEAEIIETYSPIELFKYAPVEAIICELHLDLPGLYYSGYNPEELVIIKFKDLGLDFVEEGIYCDASLTMQDRDLCANFVKASVEGWDKVFEDEEAALEIVLSYLRQNQLPANRTYERVIISKMKESFFPDDKTHHPYLLNKPDYDFAQKKLKELGVIKYLLPYKKFYINIVPNK